MEIRKMRRILVDMDGVLADVYHRFFELHKGESGEPLSIQNIIGLKEEEAFPNQLKWVNTPGFFRNVPVMPGSRQGLMRLNDNFEVVVVSMATQFPKSLIDKQLWLAEHFPYIRWEQIIFCGRKDIINADIMIDDHSKNLDNFNGETIMYSQPHNMNLTDSRHRRVETWSEIENILLPQ
jgi:5'-nucleotidase